MIKYISYARKSSESSERQILSINDQLSAVRSKFTDLDFTEAPPESKSAFHPNNRPIFDHVLQQIEEGKAQGLLAWHPNRLSRNEIDGARIIYLIRTGKLLDLKFVTYTFENSPEGIWYLQMQLSQSQYESAKLGRDVTRGLDTKIAQGHSPHKAPPGYLNTGEKIKKGERYIHADKKRLPLVRKAFEMALTGNFTTAQIYWEMRKWGFTTATLNRRPKPITYAQVYKMLRSPFYAGYFVHNHQIHKGSHPAIISWGEHERLQEIMQNSKVSKMHRRVRRHYVAYSGLMRCGGCGLTITATERRKFYRGTNREAIYIYYSCTRKSTRRDKCHQPRVSDPQLNDALNDEVGKYGILPEFRDLAVDYLRHHYRTQEDLNEAVRANQRHQIPALKDRLRRIIDLRADGELDAEDFKDKQAALKKQIASLDKDVSRDIKLRPTAQQAATTLFSDLATIAEKFHVTTPEEKREILTAMTDSNPVLKDREVRLKAKKWLDVIQQSHSAIELPYLMTQTPNFGSAEDRLCVLLGIISFWCNKVTAVADLIEDTIAKGDRILPPLKDDQNRGID